MKLKVVRQKFEDNTMALWNCSIDVRNINGL